MTAGCAGEDKLTGSSGTPRDKYEVYKKKYEGCTYIEKSLVIVHLYMRDLAVSNASYYDIGFLKDIREVHDYVLIQENIIDVTPLWNLSVIRGVNLYDKKYSLYVEHNLIGELQLKSLKGSLNVYSVGHCIYYSNQQL